MITSFGFPMSEDRPKNLFTQLTNNTIIICESSISFNKAASFFTEVMETGDSEWFWTSETGQPVHVSLSAESEYINIFTVKEADSSQTITVLNMLTSCQEELDNVLSKVRKATDPNDLWFFADDSWLLSTAYITGTVHPPYAFTAFKEYNLIWDKGMDWIIKQGLIHGRFGIHVKLHDKPY